MSLIAVVVAIACLMIGLSVGWFLGSRPARDALARLDLASEQRNAALRDLAVEKERADQAADLRVRLDAVMAEREEALRRLAAIEAEHQARSESFTAQLRTLTEAKEQLSAQFSEIGGKLLGQAQRDFLERADQRLHQAHEKSEAQLKSLLQPVNETIKLYDQKISQIEQQRTEAYGNLTGLMDSMRIGQEAVRSEAQRLVNSLRGASKARGNWGEQQLRNVLESCGLSEHADFQTEVSVEVEDGRLRPDVIIKVPGGRALVIDAKVSLNAYQDAYSAEGEDEKRGHLAR
ncbi:MAG: DNA recombination protein RmuC, partial [Sphingobium sp.]